MLVGASITSFDDRGVRLVAALVIAVATSLTIGLVHIAAVTASILHPVEELAAATRRVEAGDYGPAVAVITTDELGELSRSFNRMVAGLREREALHAALGRYADPEVARRVLDDPDALAGEEVEVTVMFVDIRGFTTATDGVAPREAVARLNDFFEVVVPVLQAHGGHANKFVGDGLLGVFGVPEHHADHADRALAAACDVHRRVAEAFAGERADRHRRQHRARARRHGRRRRQARVHADRRRGQRRRPRRGAHQGDGRRRPLHGGDAPGPAARRRRPAASWRARAARQGRADAALRRRLMREQRSHRPRHQLELPRLFPQRPEVDPLAAGLGVTREELGAVLDGTDTDLRPELVGIAS